MDDEAQDRLNKIREFGGFRKTRGDVLKGVVNTIVGSVQREVKLLIKKAVFYGPL